MEQGKMNCFWKNIDGLRTYHHLSMERFCAEINKASGAASGSPAYLTKAAYCTRLRAQSGKTPPEMLASCIDSLYCGGNGLEGDRYDIRYNLLGDKELSYLSTGRCDAGSMEDAVQTFWSNYSLIEKAHVGIMGFPPKWPHATQYFHKVLSVRKALPPLAVIRDISDMLGLTPYPILYLTRLDGAAMDGISRHFFCKSIVPQAIGHPILSENDMRAAVDAFLFQLGGFRAELDGLENSLRRMKTLMEGGCRWEED